MQCAALTLKRLRPCTKVGALQCPLLLGDSPPAAPRLTAAAAPHQTCSEVGLHSQAPFRHL